MSRRGPTGFPDKVQRFEATPSSAAAFHEIPMYFVDVTLVSRSIVWCVFP
jgi:hypothetical protein